MSISTHILDTALGRPAAGIAVSLSRCDQAAWTLLHHAATDDNGRVAALLPDAGRVAAGIFRLRFETAPYFAAQGLPTLYPYVEITFHVDDIDQHYHIPLLLTPHSYTTYRGS